MFHFKRISGLMKELKHAEPPSHHVFVDTESKWSQLDGRNDITRHQLRFGIAHYHQWDGEQFTGARECHFEDKEAFWEWLSTIPAGGRCWVWAHNIAFDGTLLGLWDVLQSDGCKLIHFTDCNLPAFFQCTIDGKPFQFLDSLNLFRQSLGSIGMELGIPKLPFPSQDAPYEQWVTYCRNDVVILAKIIEKWIQFNQKHQLGKMSSSLAGQSLTAYRTKFMKWPIHIHCNKLATALERDGYYGGIVHPYYIGEVKESPVYEFDINSLYPFVMKQHKYPNMYCGFAREPALKEVRKIMKDYYCIAQVKVKSTTITLPMRYKGRLTFPLGEYYTVLHHPELEWALDSGVVEECLMLCRYSAATLFKDYVDYFYKVRQEYKAAGEGAFSYMCKIFMNSLYGKFGQRKPKWEKYSEELVAHLELKGGMMPGQLDMLREHIQQMDNFEFRLRHPFNNVVYGARRILGQDQLLTSEDESSFSFPAISGAVTSYARLLVRQIQAAIGRHNCFYTDTDSFFVNAKGRKELLRLGLVDDSVIGKLKQNTVNEWMIIHGPKDYHTDNETKLKGIRGNAEVVDENTFIQDQWPGFKSIVKEGYPEVVDVRKIRKQLRRQLLTLRVRDDGWTYPLHLIIREHKEY